MKRILNSNIKNALAFTILSGGLINVLIAEKADAAILVKGMEIGGNVEITLTGSLNVTDLESKSALYPQATRISPESGLVAFNPTEPVIIPNLDVYVNLIDNPSNLSFGSGMRNDPDSKSGDSVVLGIFQRDDVWKSRVRLPENYAGEELFSTMTFNNINFATLGIDLGVYSSTFNSGSDIITYDFTNLSTETPTNVPEPVTILGTITALGLGSLMKKRKMQND